MTIIGWTEIITVTVWNMVMKHWWEMKETKLHFQIFFVTELVNPFPFIFQPLHVGRSHSDVLRFPWNQRTQQPKPVMTLKPQQRHWTWAGWDLTSGSRLPQSLVASQLHTEETHADKCRLDSGLGLIPSEDNCLRQHCAGPHCFTLKRPEKTKARLVSVNLAQGNHQIGSHDLQQSTVYSR